MMAIESPATIRRPLAAWIGPLRDRAPAPWNDPRIIGIGDIDRDEIHVLCDDRSPLPRLPATFEFASGRLRLVAVGIEPPTLHRFPTRERPISPGCSIGRLDDAPGTMTAGVVRTPHGAERFLLSCEHVLLPHGADRPGPVSQPATQDSLGLGEYDQVAEAVEGAGLSPHLVNEVDAAIARLHPDIQIERFVSGAGARVDQIGDVPDDQARVEIYGRSTESAGSIVSRVQSVSLGHPSGGLRPPLTFGELVVASYESAPGDSGAPVLDASTGRLIGIHVGGSRNRRCGYFCPIGQIFDALRIGLA